MNIHIVLIGLLSLISLISFVCSLENPDCQRIRQPWHAQTDEEKNLFVSGLLELRKQGKGSIKDDEFINIASVFDDSSKVLQPKASAYLFWHGYLVWELESRIRNLDGKWKCFGMPYWDFAQEAGREQNAIIFGRAHRREIGANGDPNDYWTVNEWTWDVSTREYWVPNTCSSPSDKHPLCSLKRSLRPANKEWSMPKPESIGKLFKTKTKFSDFAPAYAEIAASAIHLIDAHIDAKEMNKYNHAYDPLWWLFHSSIQLQFSLWQDCNGYLNIDVKDLDKHQDAFSSLSDGVGLDDKFIFGGALKKKKWSYISSKEVSVRSMYWMPSWNIRYDLDNGEGFWKLSGVGTQCKEKINHDWFIVDRLDMSSEHWSTHWMFDVIVDGLAVVLVVGFMRYSKLI